MKIPEKELSAIDSDLQALAGARAVLWRYSVSHSTLEIRLVWPELKGNTHLICEGCVNLQSAASWPDAHFHLSTIAGDRELLLITDEQGEFRVTCGLARIEKNVEPIF